MEDSGTESDDETDKEEGDDIESEEGDLSKLVQSLPYLLSLDRNDQINERLLFT